MGALCCCCPKKEDNGDIPQTSKVRDCTILVVGDVNVGKTTLINCFRTEKSQSEEPPNRTLTVEQTDKKVTING